MKITVFLLILFASPSLFAKNKGFEVTDPGLGAFEMTVKNIGDPVYSPYLMTLTAQCNGQSKVVPLITELSICEMTEYVYNEKSHTLTIVYRTSEPEPGEAKCNTKHAPNFKLKKICAH